MIEKVGIASYMMGWVRGFLPEQSAILSSGQANTGNSLLVGHDPIRKYLCTADRKNPTRRRQYSVREVSALGKKSRERVSQKFWKRAWRETGRLDRGGE